MLRWKKWPLETGLGRVSANPNRRSDYHDGVTIYVTVAPKGGDWRSDLQGWYFYGSVEGEKINTADNLAPTEAEAKKQAVAWVKNALKQKAVSQA